MAGTKERASRAGGTIAENRRASFDYEILKKYEAGIELLGHEVKSAKSGALQIAGARVVIRGNRKASGAVARAGEAYLVNSHIPPYQPKNTPLDYEEDRARRLLLRTSELKELTGNLQEKGRMLIPLRAFIKNGFIKLELGLAHIKKKSDKREVLKKRTHQREIERGE